MLNIFVAGGHHSCTKAARLYVQMMLKYGEGSLEQQAIIESFKMTGIHVARYSSHEWLGVWSNLCIEQTLMRTLKSNGGLSGGCFCNGESSHRSWVQTLSHLYLINRLSETVASTATHQDLALAQRLVDEKAMALVNSWLEEMEPFDKINAQNILTSFSTGFISKDGDGINHEKALELGRELQVQIDGNIPTATLWRTLKVKSLAALRKKRYRKSKNAF